MMRQLILRTEVETRQEEDVRIDSISLTSETPVLTYDWSIGEYYLQLDHGTMKQRESIPFLFNHQRDNLLGRLENHRVDDKKGYYDIKWGKSGLAQEKRADFEADVLVDTSVGFMLEDMELVKKDYENGRPLFRASAWTVKEGSLVTIPADESVGKARCYSPEVADGNWLQRMDELKEFGSQPKDDTNKNKELEMAEQVDVVQVRQSAREEMLNDSRWVDDLEINAKEKLGAEFQAFTREEKDGFLNGNLTREDMQKKWGERVLSKFGQQKPAHDVDLPNSDKRAFDPIKGLEDIEANRFNKTREFEVSEYIAKVTGQNWNGRSVLVPYSMEKFKERAGLSAGTATSGAELVGTLHGQFYGDPEKVLGHVQLGATIINLDGTGNLTLPKFTSKGSLTYIDGAQDDAAETAPATGKVEFSPKYARGVYPIELGMLKNASYDVRQLVSNVAIVNAAETMDAGFFHGTGTNDQPYGLANTPNIGSEAIDAVTWQKILNMYADVGSASLQGNAWALNAAGVAILMAKSKDTGSGMFIMSENGTIVGQRSVVTQSITDGFVFYGDWRWAVVARWGAIELEYDQFYSPLKGEKAVIATAAYDAGFIYPLGFSKGTGLTA